MTENKSIRVKDIEVNKGQIYGLPKNPRFIRDERFEALKKSIEDAPEMLTLRELLVYPYNDKYVVIGGNMRLRACIDLGYKEVPCKVLEEETPVAKLREYAIKDNNTLIACQSKCDSKELYKELSLKMPYYNVIVNPLGDWSGGINVDTGATNRKLGSDMGRGVTGGGLHGKDLSKVDVSLNIYLHILAQQKKRDVSSSCAIGDKCVVVGDNVIPYRNVVNVAKNFIRYVGGFEKFAEYGLIF